MKLLAKKIFNSDTMVSLRNNLGIKPLSISLDKIKQNASVSDSFCWRTDNFWSISYWTIKTKY